MKAIALARISTKEQESIPAQLERITKYLEDKDLKVIQVFELSESSTQDSRKEFLKIIDLIKKSDQPIALVVETVDRLQRSFKESVELDELRKAGKLILHFSRENLILDVNSNSADLLRWDMGVMFARSYVLQLSDNVKRSIDKKLADGELPAPAPIGYINVNLEDGSLSLRGSKKEGKKWIAPDPERRHYVLRAFELYSTGQYSIKGLAKELRKMGFTNKNGKPVTPSVVGIILSNPFYYGQMRYRGELHCHKYEPLITKWLFDKCQAVKASWKKKPFKYATKPFALRGLIRCAYCGCMISFDGKKDSKYVYGYCSKYKGECGAVGVTEKALMKQISKVFKGLHIPEEVLEDLKARLQAATDAERKFHNDSVKALRVEHDMIQRKLNKLLDMRLEESITKNEYDEKAKEFKNRQYEIDEACRNHTKADESFGITVSYLLDLSARASELFENSEAEQKRQLVNFVLSNLKLEGKKLLFKLKTPFDAITEANKTNKWLLGLDSNQ